MKAILSRAALAAILPTLAVAQQFADKLPASTYVYTSTIGMARGAQAADALPIAELVRGVVDKMPADSRARYEKFFLQQVADELKRELGGVGVQMEDVRAVAGVPMAFAVGRMTIRGMGPSVTLLAELGNARAAADRLIAVAVETAQQMHPGITLADTEVAGAKLRQVVIPAGPTVVFGDFQGTFVISNSPGYLEEMAAVAKGAPSLSKATGLGRCTQRRGGETLSDFYVHTGQLLGMFGPHLPYEAGQLGSALGVEALDGIYFGSGVDGKAGSDLFHIGLKGNPKGLVKALISKPMDLGAAKYCSDESVAFLSASFDPEGVIEAGRGLLDLLGGWFHIDITELIHRELGGELRREGVDLQLLETVCKALGHNLTINLQLAKGALPKPDALVFLSVRDAEAVRGLMGQIEAMVGNETGLQFRERKSNGATIRYCSVPAGELAISACWTVHDGMLILCSDVGALVRSLSLPERGGSLAEAEDFKAVTAPNAAATGMMHLRLFRAAEIGWPALETWGFPQLDAHSDQVGFGSEVMPTQEEVTAALGTLTMMRHVDEHGISIRSVGSVGYWAVLAGYSRLIDEVLRRAGAKVF